MYGPVGQQHSVPLAGAAAMTLMYANSDPLRINLSRYQQDAGLGLALVPLFILLAVAILATAIVIVALLTGSARQAHISEVQVTQAKATAAVSASNAAVALQKQCIAGGGNNVQCTQAAGAAMSQTLTAAKNLFNSSPSSSSWSVWEYIGVGTVVAVASIVAFTAYKKYKRRDRRMSNYQTREYIHEGGI